MPPSGSQAPSLPPRALCGPHVSPSTSALSLVLSHGDCRKVSQGAPCWVSPNAHQDPVGEGRESGRALPSHPHPHPHPPRRGRACPLGLGTISHHGSSRSYSTCQAESHRDWWGAGRVTFPSSPISAGFDCCNQPYFKHVSTDPDSVLCGLMGGFVAGRTQSHHTEVKGDRVSPKHSWPWWWWGAGGDGCQGNEYWAA